MFSLLRRKKPAKNPRCVALVAAAGQSSRMGGINKLMEPLDGKPVLVHTLLALETAQRVNEIIIATREEEIVPLANLCKTYGITKCTKVICGGESRAHSVFKAALEAGSDADYLAVQDGARPLVSPKLIDTTIQAALHYQAVAPAIALKDTVKEMAENHCVSKTLERSSLRAVQTPQVFQADLLKCALQQAIDQKLPITDDCSAVELLGKQVYLIPGEETNLKITTPMDLMLAQMLLSSGTLHQDK